MKQHPGWMLSVLAMIHFCGPALAAKDSKQVLVEANIVNVKPGDVFTNQKDLDGAIDFQGKQSLGISDLGGTWTVRSKKWVGVEGFTPNTLSNTRVGADFKLEDGRDLIVIVDGNQINEFGRNTSGAVNVFTKVGSDTEIPGLSGKHAVKTPVDLLISLTPKVPEEILAFHANSTPTLIRSRNGELSKLVAVGDPIPDRPGLSFTELGANAPINADYAAFIGHGGSMMGAYSVSHADGVVRAMVENDFIPDPYGFVNDVDLGPDFAVVATAKALLRADPSGMKPPEILIAAGTEYAPGASLYSFSEVKVDGDKVAFRASAQGMAGAFVYDMNTGEILRLADIDTPVPGGSGNFVSADSIGISGDLVAFIGFDESFQQAGLFLHTGGDLLRVAGKGDVKDGKTINVVGYAPDAIDKNVLAYTAYFTDGSSAAYLVAVVPEPATWMLLIAGLALVLTAAHRGRPAAGW